MIRKVVTPSDESISIHLPKSFVGKKVEIIVFISEEVSEEGANIDIQPSKYAIANKILSSDWLPYKKDDNVWRDL